MLVRHGFIYLLAKIAPAILSLAALSVFTRYLTPAQYGTYSLTILTAGLFNAVGLHWVVLGVGRYLPDCADRASIERLIGTARTVVFIISGVLLPVFIALNYLKGVVDTSVLFYSLGILVFAQAWYDLNLRIMNAKLKPANYGLILACKSAVAFLLGALAVYLGYGPDMVIWSLVIALLVSAGLGIKIWKSVPWLLIDRQQLRKLWFYGGPLTITFLLTFIIDASDRFFIDWLIGSKELGTYSAAYDFTQYSVGTLLSVVHLAAFPLVVNAYTSGGEAGAQRELQKVFIFVLAILTPVCAGLAAVSDNVAQVVMGQDFTQQSARIIPLIALALFFSCLRSYYFTYAFQLSSLTKYFLSATAIAALVNLFLNYLLIPVYGVVGAAYATIVAFFVALAISIYFSYKAFNMPSIPWIEVLKILLAVIAMLAVVKLIDVGSVTVELILQIITGGIVYGGFIFVFNLVRIRDWLIKKVF